MKPELVIAAVAMITPVGLYPQQACASIRSGIARFAERDGYKQDDPLVMSVVPDDCLPEIAAESQFKGKLEKRFARFILALSSQMKSWTMGTGPILLGLPDALEHKTIDGEKLLRFFGEQDKNHFEMATSQVIAKGRASGLLALEQASTLLQTGSAKYVFVAGVDSFNAREPLLLLDGAQRLKRESVGDGFIPGEGAGLLLLTTKEVAHGASQNVVKNVTSGFEQGHYYSEEPYRGDGLAATVSQLLEPSAAEAQKVGSVFSSMNGESYWAKEWGTTLIRNRRYFQEDPILNHPADCYGDLGAACGPVMIGLYMGMKQAGPCLVYASSDGGPRAAVLVEKNL